jgi:hypothetical protein
MLTVFFANCAAIDRSSYTCNIKLSQSYIYRSVEDYVYSYNGDKTVVSKQCGSQLAKL